MRLLWTLVLSVLISSSTACAGPTAPDVIDTLPLSPGRYMLFADAQPYCPEASFSSVGMDLTIARDRQEWVGRSTTPADGDVELRFRQTGTDLGVPIVEGTIRGTGIGLRSPSSVVTFTSARVLGGLSDPNDVYMGGVLRGTRGFTTHWTGRQVTCTQATWVFRRPGPCESRAGC